MDASDQLKQEVREGRIDLDRLVELVVTLQRQLQAAQQRIDTLEKQVGGITPSASAPLEQPFSVRAEEQRQQAHSKNQKRGPKNKGRRGRVTSADKSAQAKRHEDVVPKGFAQSDCQESHCRPVWRLEQGRAILVAYHIYRGPRHQYGQIPGVLGRGEFGSEIILEIAYLVYVVGLSFDKVGALLQFFQELRLRKSPVDALLPRLARHWQQEFETLCTLLAHSLVVHADETRWSLPSVGAFLSAKARLLFYGVHQDADTLQLLLDPATFGGILVSDDAAV